MCNSLNLCAIFWEGDLVNRAGAHECKITRDATPEAQECGCSGAALCRCCFGAALRWALLLRLCISFGHIITTVVALSAISGVTVVSTSNKNGARIGDERAKLPESCMRLRCGEVENLSTNLRVRTGRIARCLGINERPRAT